MTHLAKEQTAAQVLAVIQARFERPTLEDIQDVLERVKAQAAVSEPRTEAVGPQKLLLLPQRRGHPPLDLSGIEQLPTPEDNFDFENMAVPRPRW